MIRESELGVSVVHTKLPVEDPGGGGDGDGEGEGEGLGDGDGSGDGDGLGDGAGSVEGMIGRRIPSTSTSLEMSASNLERMPSRVVELSVKVIMLRRSSMVVVSFDSTVVLVDARSAGHGAAREMSRAHSTHSLPACSELA